MTITTKDWKHCFPFEKIRPEQEEAINFTLNSFKNEKKIVIAELGTGVGKSCIGFTIAKFLNQTKNSKSYFLTSQKILQDQYVRDFGEPNDKLVSLKSKSNYQCTFYKEFTCQEGQSLLRREEIEKDEFYKNCKKKCIYTKDRNKFIEGNFSLTNFLFFLTSKTFKKRDLLVIDECHYIEDVLSNFIETSISKTYCESEFGVEFPKFPIGQEEAFTWFKHKLQPAVIKKREKVERTIKKIEQISNNKLLLRVSKISKQFQRVSRLEEKIKEFVHSYSPNTWVMNLLNANGIKSERIEFKPIYVEQHVRKKLLKYGKNILLMSATILDTEIYIKSLGIEKDEVAIISKDSPFPIENKPIFYLPSGKMSRNEIDNSLPNLVENIKQIIKLHNKEKGIIHTRSYKISNFIKNNLKSRRLLFHNEKNRDKILEKHMASPKPTILVSPSMGEGVDLKDDLSRFQIICKLPYPYLGDKINQKKMQNDKNWYYFMTAKSIIQSIGRSIRNENDYATTYILDECWEYFFEKNKNMFPESFRKSITSY